MKKNEVTNTTDLGESSKIWSEIKDMTLNIYALPNQKVSNHVTVLEVPGDELYLKLKSTAVLPALEESLGSKYEVELSEKYTIVRRVRVNSSLKKALLKA